MPSHEGSEHPSQQNSIIPLPQTAISFTAETGGLSALIGLELTECADIA